MPNFLWFRAFNRSTANELIVVLRDGDTPHPDPTSATRRHEVELGIEPPCVYAYLGMTLEEFGKSAVACSFEGFDGQVSPFDTGGLVNKIRPVCDWDPDDRKRFLSSCSWPHTDLPSLLASYPGATSTELREYLDGAQPPQPGFHAVRAGVPEANIWADNDDRRAWVWEGRRQERLLLRDALAAWTCPAEQYAALLKIAAAAAPGDRSWFRELVRRHVRGGVTELLRHVRARQEAA